MKIIWHWIILSLAVLATTYFVKGISVNPIWVIFIVGACLTIFNMFIKPIITILTLPLTIITLGLFSLVINGLLFWFLGTIIKGFSVATFEAAFLGALIISIISWLATKILRID